MRLCQKIGNHAASDEGTVIMALATFVEIKGSGIVTIIIRATRGTGIPVAATETLLRTNDRK